VSEVADLAAELAPRPSKPVMVSPVSVGGSMGGGGVMSVPVESAFSAGGVMKSVRSEVQVPLAAANPEETGSWRPSAASALASLVKEEMEALAKPAPPPVVDDPVGVGDSPMSSPVGLLGDLPEASIAQPAKAKVNGNNGHSGKTPLGEGAGEMTAAHGPRNPYIANPGATYSSPAVTQYRPDRGPNTTLIAILVLGGVAVLGIVAFVIVSVMKPVAPVVTPQQPPVVQQPIAQQPPTNNPNVNTAGQPNTQPGQNPPGNTQPTAAGTNPPANTNNPPPANTAGQPGTTGTTAPPAKQPVKVAAVTAPPKPKEPGERPPPKEKPEPAEKPEKKAAEPKGGDDEFAAAFGGEKPKKETKNDKGSEKPADDSSAKKSVYVAPRARRRRHHSRVARPVRHHGSGEGQHRRDQEVRRRAEGERAGHDRQAGHEVDDSHFGQEHQGRGRLGRVQVDVPRRLRGRAHQDLAVPQAQDAGRAGRLSPSSSSYPVRTSRPRSSVRVIPSAGWRD